MCMLSVGGVEIVEYRVSEGYGASWAIIRLAGNPITGERTRNYVIKCEFRGFLEPHVIDGHEKKWRH